MLLGPAASQLGARRLVIVASGALVYLPFAALPIPSSSIYQPLITEHEIVNLPSASVLSVIRRETAGRQKAAKTVAVLADPVFEMTDPRVTLAKNKSLSKETQVAINTQSAPTPVAPGLTRSLSTMNLSNDRSRLTRLPFSRKSRRIFSPLFLLDRG